MPHEQFKDTHTLMYFIANTWKER